MNRKNIVTLPHARLREKSQRVSKFDEELTDFVNQMTAASLDWEDHREHEFCVGLAAAQVDDLRKIVILRDNLEDKQDKRFTPIINPKVIKTYGEPVLDFEGCLSVRNIYGKVPRYPKVKIKAQDLEGREFRMTAEGFQAKLIQHEIDHTNGIVFIDHIRETPEAFFSLRDDGEVTPMDYKNDIKDSDELWQD